MHLSRFYSETALCRPLPPQGQLVGREGGGFESPVGQLNDDEHGHEPTNVGKMIQTLMQDITYLTVGCMCSRNENMTGIAGLVAAFTKGRHSVMVRGVVMVVVVTVVVTAVMIGDGDGGEVVIVVVIAVMVGGDSDSGEVNSGGDGGEVVGGSGDGGEVVGGMH